SEVCVKHRDEEFMKEFELLGLASDDTRWVIVNMYDPFLSDDDITAFLEMHVESASAPKRIYDRFGYWTGRRQYEVTLKVNKNYEGGFAHPPALFALGGSRGYLFYRDQPPFCRKCHEIGHVEKDCRTTSCTRCGAEGHTKRTCRIKVCSLCGADTHLYRACLKRDLTFVAAEK
uniref:CCHC-type domain-containing protein n=1 Tax=Lepisosteus oculatus TaxID=7918 RepID=W5NM86_LEPOC